jgi:hypothetical protein
MKIARLLTAVAAAGLLVGAPVVDAAKKKPPQKKGATYKGTTSQGSVCRVNGENDVRCVVTVKVAGNGKHVSEMVITYGAPCSNPDLYFRSSTRFTKVKLSSKGKFALNAQYDETIGDQGSAHNTVAMHGKFKHKGKRYTVAGDFQVSSDLTFTDGSTTQCESGPVKWSGKH